MSSTLPASTTFLQTITAPLKLCTTWEDVLQAGPNRHVAQPCQSLHRMCHETAGSFPIADAVQNPCTSLTEQRVPQCSAAPSPLMPAPILPARSYMAFLVHGSGFRACTHTAAERRSGSRPPSLRQLHAGMSLRIGQGRAAAARHSPQPPRGLSGPLQVSRGLAHRVSCVLQLHAR